LSILIWHFSFIEEQINFLNKLFKVKNIKYIKKNKSKKHIYTYVILSKIFGLEVFIHLYFTLFF